MQSLLFVFIGLTQKNSDANLSILMERLNEKFEKDKLAISFSQKDELLSARFNEVSFYISFLKNKNELKEWKQMAKNFELKFNDKPVNKIELVTRYNSLQRSQSNLYKEIHFEIGISIIEEMEKGVEPQNFKKTVSILDRKQAIKTACQLANPNDIILIAGKGHETYQEINGVRHDFDDLKIVTELLQQLNK